jgi:hypothetical protein
MRSVHSADLQHVAFVDAFGLTRVSLPNKVKSERRLAAGFDASLSLNAARTELLASHPRRGRMLRLAFPGMTVRAKYSDLAGTRDALAPDGGFADIIAPPPTRLVGSLCRYLDPHDEPTRTTLDLDRAPVREGVFMDGAKPAWRDTRLVTAPSGVWAALFDEAQTLLVGDLSSPGGRLRWSAPVRLPREALVTLHPFDDGQLVLAVFSPSRCESTLVRFDPEGNTLGRHVVPALSPAAPLSPARVVHQTRGDTVAQTFLVDGDSRTTALAPEDHGVGRVLGVEGAAFFLPWHAESLVDLQTGAVISRALAEADAPARRWVRAHLARANALGNPGGILFELWDFDPRPATKFFEFTVEATAGDGSLLAALAAGMLTGVGEDAIDDLPGWRCRNAGDVLSEFDPGRWDAAEVDLAFAALESAGVHLLSTLGCFGDAYGMSYEMPALQQLPFTPEGARRFLAGMTRALEHGAAPGLRNAAQSRSPTLTATHVADALRVLPHDRPLAVPADALDHLMVLAGEVFGDELPTVLAALCEVPDAWREGLGTRLEAAVRWALSASENPEGLSAKLTDASRAHRAVARIARGALD